MQNFEGYDIDPTMGRIAQVNMYLHLFKNPKIFQYDTLTSEERWNDKFDVILANPPFMTPKGGIKPHNKFGIQANRSEVLFVDYISSHLRPKGRAGIIVPEGIIFQSGKAYKELRKNLVGSGLYAVVSLPSGVFQPYSGVKTSILFLNGEIAKEKTEILFAKISADGFDLGSTKKPVAKNDLPEALEAIHLWEKGKKVENSLISFVSKEEIATNGDYNLSGDRYRAGVDYSNSKWPMVKLRELLEVQNGYAFDSKHFSDSKLGTPIIRIRDVNSGFSETYYDGDYDKKYLVRDGDLLIGMDGDFRTALWSHGSALLNQRVCRLQNFNGVIKRYVYFLIQSELSRIQSATYAVTVKHISSKQIEEIEIPLPPVEIQEQIVAELDRYAAIISGAKQIVENWKPRIDVDPEWPSTKLSEICKLITKGTTPTSVGFDFVDSGINFVKVESITGNGQFIPSKFAHISDECHKSLNRSQLHEGDVLFSIAGALGRTAVVPKEILPANTNQALAILRLKPDVEVHPQFLEYLLVTDVARDQSAQNKTGVAQQNISLGQLGEYLLPIPSLEVQTLLVEKVKKEEALVAGSILLAEQFEARTQAVIAKHWNAN
jgi:type I restriction enzyme M protein